MGGPEPQPDLERHRLRRVAWARNQAEAELIGGMLSEEGIPSLEKRARGFDVPDFLAGGPRELYVPEPAYEAARDLLGEQAPEAVASAGGDGDEEGQEAGIIRPSRTFLSPEAVRLMLGILIVLALGVVVALISFSPG